MTVAFDASTPSIRTATTDPYTFSHTGRAEGSGGVQAVVVSIINYTTATDQVTGVTYGGVALSEIIAATDSADEPSNVQLWFVGSGLSGLGGSQTVSVDFSSATGDDFQIVALTFTAAGDCIPRSSAALSDNQADPQAVLATGGAVSMAVSAFASGADSVPTLLSGMTNVSSNDSGVERQHVDRQTTASSSSFTIGYTIATDDVAFAAFNFTDEVVDPLPSRVSQEPVEAAILPDTQLGRVTQLPVEVAVIPDTQKGRISQLAVEVLVLPEPAFTLDAILLDTQEATFALDAVLSAEGAFTLDAVLFEEQAASFTLDAIVFEEQLASLTLDAQLFVQYEASLTLDAVLFKETSATFTLDAVIAAAGEVASSFTFDAVLLEEQAATFTLDAVLLDEQSATFALDAVITAAAIFTLDAVIAAVANTVNGSFTFNAVLLKQIFSDDFGRSVDLGLGGPWSWHVYDSSFNDTSGITSLVASGTAILPGAGGDDHYEAWVGIPRPETGDAYFDFFATQGPVDDRPTYGFTLDVENYYGVYVVSDNTASLWTLQTFFASDAPAAFTAVDNTWYRFHARWTDDRVRIRVWERDDPEPTTWLYDRPTQFNFAGDAGQAPPFLDLYFFPRSPDDGVIDNVEIWSMESTWQGFGGWQFDAVITIGTTWSFNAVIQDEQAASFTLDAVVGSGFTLDAIITGPATPGDFTFDAYFQSLHRAQHHRGNEPHFGVDTDTVIVLAGALGMQTTGATLHELLVEIEARISALEG